MESDLSIFLILLGHVEQRERGLGKREQTTSRSRLRLRQEHCLLDGEGDDGVHRRVTLAQGGSPHRHGRLGFGWENNCAIQVGQE